MPVTRFDRASAWLIRRTGRHLIATTWGVLCLVILFVVVPVQSSFNYWAANATTAEVVRIAFVFELFFVPAALLSWGWVVVDARPLSRWLAGDHSQAAGEAAHAWIVAGLPRAVVRVSLLFVLASMPAGAYAALLLDVSAAATVAFVAGVGITVLGPAVLLYLVFEQALRIVLDEIAAQCDLSRATVRGLSLQSKVLIAVPVICLYSTMIVGILSSANVGPDRKIILVVALAVSFSLTVGAAFAILVRRSLLDRMVTLRDAMTDVAHGVFDRRLFAAYGDELDDVVAGYNSMTVRLATHSEEMRESRARIVAAADGSRRQIERDLHDGAQQYLVLMELKLGLLKRAADDAARVRAIGDELKADLGKALNELRDLAHGLYPAVLESDGLAAALQAAGERSTLPVSVAADGVGRFAPEVEAAVYFCCLEAMQNAAKHAGNSASITVRLSPDDGVLTFAVSDDGAGYDVTALGASHGLTNMADRLGALGGSLAIDSTPGVGTTVSGTVPVGAR